MIHGKKKFKNQRLTRGMPLTALIIFFLLKGTQLKHFFKSLDKIESCLKAGTKPKLPNESEYHSTN